MSSGGHVRSSFMVMNNPCVDAPDEKQKKSYLRNHKNDPLRALISACGEGNIGAVLALAPLWMWMASSLVSVVSTTSIQALWGWIIHTELLLIPRILYAHTMTIGIWIQVECPGGSRSCQTPVMACCVAGQVPILSYLVTQHGADITLAGIVHALTLIYDGLHWFNAYCHRRWRAVPLFGRLLVCTYISDGLAGIPWAALIRVDTRWYVCHVIINGGLMLMGVVHGWMYTLPRVYHI